MTYKIKFHKIKKCSDSSKNTMCRYLRKMYTSIKFKSKFELFQVLIAKKKNSHKFELSVPLRYSYTGMLDCLQIS